MTFGHKATRAHKLAIASLGAAVAVSGLVSASPAVAQYQSTQRQADGAARSGKAGCLTQQTAAGSTSALRLRRDTDEGDDLSPTARVQVQREINQTADAYHVSSGSRGARTATTSTPPVRVAVWIHVIRGTERGDRVLGRPGALKTYRQLKYGFNGGQNPAMAGSGIIFRLRGVDFHTNNEWFHAGPLSAADNQMKRKLHRGYGWGLNIYLKAPKYSGDTLLGYSRFPWQYRYNRKLDGVTVHVDALSGGRYRGYNHGDTLIHETGHWFGLLHPFEGGCTGLGDGVADTPAEAAPAQGCPIGRDTCTAQPGVDPVTNFMDYGYDTCMNTFTPGQQARMKAAFLRFRYQKK